jgi:hypothetical protein
MTSKRTAFVDFAQSVMDLHRVRGYPYPPVLKQNGPDSDIIALEFHTVSAATTWAKFFGVQAMNPYRHPVLPVRIVHYTVDYHGWHLQISGRERTKVKV